MIIAEVQEGFNAYMDISCFVRNPYRKVPYHNCTETAYWLWEHGRNKAIEHCQGIVDDEINELYNAYELQTAYKKVHNDVIGKILADRDLNNVNKPDWIKRLFKYRSWQYGILSLTLFQEKRYELGLTFDHSEQPSLLAISLIFIHFEITF